MEYEEEENSVPGSYPEFGAIFMLSAETKRECFKRKIFALPSWKVSFVEQVKAGMVLFFFEFEKRQLFGVYKATSDGALDIHPNAFRSGGEQFRAQVRFTPIWLCSPLSENEFQSAIHENYYSARKFKFGLSKDQVCRLLQLFITRKLKDRPPSPPRQLTRRVSPFSDKGRKPIDNRRFSIKEGLEMEQSNQNFGPVMNDYSEDLEGRGTEAYDVRFYTEDRIEEEENLHSFGQGFLTDHAGDSLQKRRRISYEGLETDKSCASSLSFATDNREIPIPKERIPATSSRFLGGENIGDGCNIFNRLSPAKYSELPFDLTKAVDYEGPYSDGINRHAMFDDKFLMNDITKTELGLHNAFRPVITNEHDLCLFERAGKTADDCEILMDSKLGHKHHIDDGIAPVVPSESFGISLHRVRETAGYRKYLTNERIISEHDPDSSQGISFSSAKVANPSDAHQRKFDEQRFSRDNLVKANFMEGLNSSATLNMTSGYDTRIERQIANDFGFSKTSSVDVHHVGTLPRPVMSNKSSAFHQPCQSSVECFNKPLPDTRYRGFTTQSLNFKVSNSSFHDPDVIGFVPCFSEVPIISHERSCQSARVAKESIHHHSGGNFIRLAKGKSFEAEGSNRYGASGFGSGVPFPNHHDYSGYPTDVICHGVDLKSPYSADYRNIHFSPSTLGSAPFTKSDDFSTRDNLPAFDGHPYVVSQGMQKYIRRQINDVQKYIPEQTNDEKNAGNELLSPYANSTEFDLCYPEKDPTNRHSDFSRSYRTDVIDDNIQYYRSPEGPYSDPVKHRKSVFARLTSSPKLYSQEEQEDFYAASSVDEVMEMLHQNQNFWSKNLKKFNLVIRQANEGEEMERNNKKISFENHMENGQSKIISKKINKEINPANEQCVDDKPKETRMFDFKSRREKKKNLDDKSLESNVLEKEDSVSGEIKETQGPLDKQGKRRKLVRPPLDKQGKRRKLVRPIFGHNHSN